MPQLELHAFNGFRVAQKGELVRSFRSVKERALLAYLALESHKSHARVSLAGLLWPDEPEQKARRNLSQTLLNLRKAISDHEASIFLEIHPKTIAFRLSDSTFVDVVIFSSLVSETQQHDHENLKTCEVCTKSLQTAADLYTGAFLDGFYIPETDLFEDWVISTREKLERDAIELYVTLSQAYEAQADLAKAQKVARRVLELAPWQEHAHRQLMRLLALAGKRSQAIAQYESCKETLKLELGVEPSQETIELYEQIVSGELKPEEVNPQVVLKAEPISVPFQAAPPPPHFVGRAEEIAVLSKRLLAKENAKHAIVAMGGAGKSTLALQIAQDLKQDFKDGILWANTAMSDPVDILDAWAKAYGFDFSGLPDLESRAAAVRGMLVEKDTLIILDNVSQASRARPLMAGGSSSAILVTTRDLDVANALNADALQLNELNPAMSLNLLESILGEARVQVELDAAKQICKLLHHLPLAVEIAAQRLKSRNRMKLAAMADRLGDTQHRLSLEISDVAVRTSFEVSWEALDFELRVFFPLLAVFEGRPFTPAALAYIAGIDIYTAEEYLFTLQALSLLNEEGSAHYKQHPLLADFAKEKQNDESYQQHLLLADFTKEKLQNPQDAYARMADYYYDFAAKNSRNYDELKPEWGNMIAAIKVAHKQENWQLIIDFSNVLAETWMIRGRYTEARNAYKLAQEAAENLKEKQLQSNNLLRWGEACLEQNDYEEAQRHLEQSLTYDNHYPHSVNAKYHLARIAIDQNRLTEANQHLNYCENEYKKKQDEVGLAKVNYQHARVFFDAGELEKAHQLAILSLAIFKEGAEEKFILYTLRLLAHIAIRKGRLSQALEFNEEALALTQKRQDDSEFLSVLYNMTLIYRRLEQLDKAVSFGQEASVLAQRLGRQRTQAMIEHQLSLIYKDTKEYKKALDLDLNSARIYRWLSDSIGLALSLLNIGDLYKLLRENNKGHKSWLEVKAITEKLDDPWFQEELQKRL